MTDQQSYDMLDGTPMLTIERQETLAADLLIKLPIVSDHDSVRINPHRLLAMIDTIAPDAMRAYLRETVENTYLENMGVPPVEREVPEADSPEDINERRHCDPLPVTVDARPSPATVERLSLLETVRDLYKSAPSKAHLEIVEWLIDGPKR